MTYKAKKLYKLRLRHAKFISTLIIAQPFVRAVLLNGSLAQGRAGEDSDIDLLIIAKRGRIFTARFFTILVTLISGLKRGSREESKGKGRVCLNYFLTDGFLIIPHHRSEEMNRYCAENYSHCRLLAGDPALFNKFMAMNRWMGEYVNPKLKTKNQKASPGGSNISAAPLRRSANRRRPGNLSQQFNNSTIKQLFESILSGKRGQKIEGYFRRVQLARVNKDPRTKAFPDLIAANDQEMRFHPPKIERPSL